MARYVFRTSVPVSVREYDSSLKAENITRYVCSTLCFLSIGLPSQGSSVRRITFHARIQLFLNMMALFVRIELLCSSVRRRPPNIANGVFTVCVKETQFHVKITDPGDDFHISTMLTVRSYSLLNCLYICMYVSNYE